MNEQDTRQTIDRNDFLPAGIRDGSNPAEISARGDWAGLGARAEHIADAISKAPRSGIRWMGIYNRALAHLREVTK